MRVKHSPSVRSSPPKHRKGAQSPWEEGRSEAQHGQDQPEQMKCLGCNEAPVGCWEQTTSVTVVRLEALITSVSETGGGGPDCDTICVPETRAKRPGTQGLHFAPPGLQRGEVSEQTNGVRILSLPYLTRRSRGAHTRLVVRGSPESTELPARSLWSCTYLLQGAVLRTVTTVTVTFRRGHTCPPGPLLRPQPQLE